MLNTTDTIEEIILAESWGMSNCSDPPPPSLVPLLRGDEGGIKRSRPEE
jgi:hypothetical protein